MNWVIFAFPIEGWGGGCDNFLPIMEILQPFLKSNFLLSNMDRFSYIKNFILCHFIISILVPFSFLSNT